MIAAKLERLEEVVRGYGPTVTAFSGGVDSMTLASFAHRTSCHQCCADSKYCR